MANDQSTAVATREDNPLVQFREQLEQRAGELKMVLPSHITPDKFQRTVLTAVQQNPDLLNCDRRSLILACMKAAQDALLPDGREAVIYPFNTSVKVGGQWVKKKIAQYVPMVFGLRKKILQSGDVVALEVGVVYKKEADDQSHFYFEVGRYPPLGHKPMLYLTADETTDDQIVGAYSIATMKDGTKSYEFMRRFEIDKVRECSQTGATKDRNGQPRKPAGPWVEWFPEQAKKTVMRRHSKTLPQSGDVIIDVEARELDSGVSTAALLDSHVPDDPQLITDEHDETPAHDEETGEIIEGEAASQTEGDQDELGVTKDPSELAAEQAIAAFDGAVTIAALKRSYKEFEKHLAFLPGQLQTAVEDAYERNAARLAPAKQAAQAETAK